MLLYVYDAITFEGYFVDTSEFLGDGTKTSLIDLLAELEAKRLTVMQQIAEQKNAAILEIVDQAVKTAESIGASVTDLVAVMSRRRQPKSDGRAVVTVKYRNRAVPSETWSGRGIRPKWLQRELAAGAVLESFLVTPTTE